MEHSKSMRRTPIQFLRTPMSEVGWRLSFEMQFFSGSSGSSWVNLGNFFWLKKAPKKQHRYQYFKSFWQLFTLQKGWLNTCFMLPVSGILLKRAKNPHRKTHGSFWGGSMDETCPESSKNMYRSNPSPSTKRAWKFLFTPSDLFVKGRKGLKNPLVF